MSKKTKKNKPNSKSSDAFKDTFGGLKKHELDIEPISVFALKIEHCEETFSPSCPVPMMPGPAPRVPGPIS